MKVSIVLFICLLSNSLLAMNTKQLAAKKREKALDKFQVKAATINSCDQNSSRVKTLQGLISKSTTASDKKTLPSRNLYALEQEEAKLKAEQVLIKGIKALNSEYKSFLDSISNTEFLGHDDESGKLTFNKLKSDIESAKDHLNNVATMGVMDALLKEAIGNPNALLPKESQIPNASVKDKAQAHFLIDENMTGTEVYSALEKSCSKKATSSLCEIISNIGDQGKAQIKDTVEGFVNSYRLSSRNDFSLSARTNFFYNQLGDYRDALLAGVKNKTPSRLAVEIKKYKNEVFKLNSQLEEVSMGESEIHPLIDDINKYTICVAKKSLTNRKNKCDMLNSRSRVIGSLKSLGKAQEDIVSKLGTSDSSRFTDKLENVHQHQKTNKKLHALAALFKKSPLIQKSINKEVAKNSRKIKKATSDIFKKLNLEGTRKGARSTASGQNGKLETFLAQKAKYFKLKRQSPIIKKEKVSTTNKHLNNKLNSIMYGTKDCSVYQKKAEEMAGCETVNHDLTKGKEAANLFVLKNGEVIIAPSKLDHYFNLLNEGSIQEKMQKEDERLTKLLAENRQKQGQIRSSDRYKALNSLLIFHAAKIESACRYSNDKLQSVTWNCVQPGDRPSDKIHTLVNKAGEILASMPESPQNKDISTLKSLCTHEFVESFKGKKEADEIKSICDGISIGHKSYIADLIPSQAELNNKKITTKWTPNGYKKVRRRSSWSAFGVNALETGLNLVPFYAQHVNTMSGIELQKESLIGRIQYRNYITSQIYQDYANYDAFFSDYPDATYGGGSYGLGYYGGTSYANGAFPFSNTFTAVQTPGTSSGFEF